MSSDHFLSITDQVAETLREGMFHGRWRDVLPGRERLAKQLGVSHKTVEAALRCLTRQGFLKSQGPGRRRRIVLPEDAGPMAGSFRLRILGFEPQDRGFGLFVELMEQLNRAGFDVAFAEKSLMEMKMDVKRVAHCVEQTPADAWVVTAASQELLQWFSNQPLPAYALFGVKSKVPLAGTGVRRNIAPLVTKLVGLGHRRIVCITREEHIKPKPGLFVRQFLEALEHEQIPTGPYHLPVWEQSREGLHRRINSLFQHTAPTALIIEESHIFLAVKDHLASRGIIAPRDVSLICLDPDPSFSWFDPQVSHFTYNHGAIARRVVNWARKIIRGKEDLRQTFTMARFIEGGTIGPAPKA